MCSIASIGSPSSSHLQPINGLNVRVEPLLELTAVDAVDALKNHEVSPLELIDAATARITEMEPIVNALPTTMLDRARSHAKRLMVDPPAEVPPWYLHGLPTAIKDMVDVAGVVTTNGSVLDIDNVPDRSDILVEALEANGAIALAKSNVPEYGAGSHTFNDVFGPTCNPWNTSRSAGGSSGGSAAALAAGEVWLATGSDLGGSLRNPASFCGVVGLRPSPGRVAKGPSSDPWNTLVVQGPLGRTVADAALMLDAMTGAHPADPISIERPTRTFLNAALSPAAPTRVAFSADLGGITPVDPEVASICRAAVERMADAGVQIEEASIDFSDAERSFDVLRAVGYVGNHLDKLAHRDVVKEEVIWNIERGLQFSSADIAAAQAARGALYQRTATFFDRYDLLACPAAVVAPFPIEWRWPHQVGGHTVERYIDWLLICSAVSLTSCPAISVPCGLTADGLPVGLQLIAPARAEHRLLSTAAWWEAANEYAAMVPCDPQT